MKKIHIGYTLDIAKWKNSGSAREKHSRLVTFATMGAVSSACVDRKEAEAGKRADKVVDPAAW